MDGTKALLNQAAGGMIRDPLLRSVSAVALGIISLATLSLSGQAILGLAPLDDLFEPGRFAPKPLFIAGQLLITLLSAFAAGWLARRIAMRRKPVIALLVIVIVLSGFQTLWTLTIPTQTRPRTGDENVEEWKAGVVAEQPLLLTLGIPFALATGILIGSSSRLATST